LGWCAIHRQQTNRLSKNCSSRRLRRWFFFCSRNIEDATSGETMRICIPPGLLVLTVVAALATQGISDPEQQGPKKSVLDEAPTCNLHIELTDAATGHALPGVVRVRDEAGGRVNLRELTDRGLGVEDEFAIHDWFLLPQPTKVTVPQAKLTITGCHGLETEFGETTLDLSGKTEAQVRIPLKRFYDVYAHGLQSANTHVHLQKLSRMESERYLLEVARAERLDIVYISYLERAEADLEYTTNKYTKDDLRRLTRRSRGQEDRDHEERDPDAVHPNRGHPHAHPHTRAGADRFDPGTEFDNGEEHRHNFTGFEEGYGHVMLLHLSDLIQPVSIGPGITKQGTDSPSLRQGIDQARGLGGTIIWCHNQWGLEDIPNWLEGKLHANNIFDGGTHGSYKHSFYRYLNAGLKVPFSTGTDWFIYDFSRVYVFAGNGQVGGGKYLSSEQWLEQLSAGRSFITNGPLLEFSVQGNGPGDTINLKNPGPVEIRGRAWGRLDFQRIELICNGEVVKAAGSEAREGHFVAYLDLRLSVDQPCWLALRTPPPSAARDAEFQSKTPVNEYGRELFGHTSAVYVNLGDRGVFDVAAAESLLDEMKTSLEFIRSTALFANETERDGVLRIYVAGIQQMRQRIDAAREK
jgi:hypothetical protein